MDISVILAHPDNQSFNHAIARAAVTKLQKNGHNVTLHDLYAEQFDPLLSAPEISTEAVLPLDIEKHCDEIISVRH
ncbi:MAG: NAD(P)H-dependent oxidoreductase [Desulfobacterales bacterium]|nr:NAD(P)H-dependent oxidoreductase [Desulfobacterales bacterium]